MYTLENCMTITEQFMIIIFKKYSVNILSFEKYLKIFI